MLLRKVCWSTSLGLLFACSSSQAAIITTVAGGGGSDGTPASFGEGGPATTATLYQPSSIALDSSGNLYIADIYNNRVRKVTAATGIITTVAGNGTAGFSGDGGQATTAQLSSPLGIALDSSGNLYIADTGNHRVRKVTTATGIISTVAGNGTAGFSGDAKPATAAKLNYPIGLAFDSSGNLYIADSLNNRVRKLKTASGLIATVAGNGTQGFFGDGGLATTARLYGPYGVALDSSGNLFIADTGNNRVRKVTVTTGKISTVAGNGGAPGFSGDEGQATAAKLSQPRHIAVNSFGNLYIADTYNNRIRKVKTATGKITTVAGNGTVGFSGDGGQATEAKLNHPANVALDSFGNIYIADTGNHRVRKALINTITTVAGSGMTGYPGVNNFSGDGGPATAAKLYYPFDIAFDSLGNLYIPDSGNNRVRKVTAATGIITTVAGNGTAGFSGDGGPATEAALNFPVGLAFDSSGNLYISERGNNNRVRKVTAATGIITTVAGNGTVGFSGDGGPATMAQLFSPGGISLDSSGNLYIADSMNNRIRKVTAATGIITTVAGTAGASTFSGDGGPATAAKLSTDDVALDSSGNIYIGGTNRIRKVTAATGIITTVAGTGGAGADPSGDGGPATAAKLHYVRGVALDSSGNIYIGEGNGQRIRKVTAATGIINTVAGTGQTGFFGDGGPATNARFSEPYGITLDSSGNLYIADKQNHRVRKVDFDE